MQYSLPLANSIVAQGFELYGKSDLRFLHGVYGVLRELFQYQPRLTKEQFLTNGYAERKVILTYNLLLLCQARHKQLSVSAGNWGKCPKKYGSLMHTHRCPPNPPVVLTVREGSEMGSTWSEHTRNHGNGLIIGIMVNT